MEWKVVLETNKSFAHFSKGHLTVGRGVLNYDPSGLWKIYRHSFRYAQADIASVGVEQRVSPNGFGPQKARVVVKVRGSDDEQVFRVGDPESVASAISDWLQSRD
jgi:hypothetical protein